MEVMVPEITVVPTLLGRSDVSQVRHELQITPLHPDEEARPDGYWAAYIVKGRKSTAAHIRLNLTAPGGLDLESVLDTLWMDIHWVNYGPFGRLQRRQGILLALQRPDPGDPAAPCWRCRGRNQATHPPPAGARGSAAGCCRCAPICSGCSTIRWRCCSATPMGCCSRVMCSPSVRPPWR
jgi:hypothetical protein